MIIYQLTQYSHNIHISHNWKPVLQSQVWSCPQIRLEGRSKNEGKLCLPLQSVSTSQNRTSPLYDAQGTTMHGCAHITIMRGNMHMQALWVMSVHCKYKPVLCSSDRKAKCSLDLRRWQAMPKAVVLWQVDLNLMIKHQSCPTPTLVYRSYGILDIMLSGFKPSWFPSKLKAMKIKEQPPPRDSSLATIQRTRNRANFHKHCLFLLGSHCLSRGNPTSLLSSEEQRTSRKGRDFCHLCHSIEKPRRSRSFSSCFLLSPYSCTSRALKDWRVLLTRHTCP